MEKCEIEVQKLLHKMSDKIDNLLQKENRSSEITAHSEDLINYESKH
jgi:hypothetical protein